MYLRICLYVTVYLVLPCFSHVDVTHGTAAHWRYAKLRIWAKRRFDTSDTIMNALIFKQYCIKISIKKWMSLYSPGREVGGGGFIIFKNRVKFIQDGQRHRRQVTSSVFDYNGGGGGSGHISLSLK